VDTVRKRIQRGTLDADKADGKVYVWLDTHLDTSADPLLEAKEETISELRDRVVFLQRELERKDAILLNMTRGDEVPQSPARSRGVARAARIPRDGHGADEGVPPGYWRRYG
jgi:hypothetical protein